MGVFKRTNRLYKKGKRALKKRYVAKAGGRKATGGLRVMKMAKDIMYLKSVLNPEKKRFIGGAHDIAIGQVNGNTDGGYFADTTPTPAQGVTYDTRNGASIKLHSSMYHFQFTQQVGVVADLKLILEFYMITGEPYTGFTFRNERFLPNPFITGADIRDYNTQINPDNYQKGKCIARRYLTIKQDATGSVKNLTDLKIPILHNKGQGHHIRFNKDTQTVEHGQIFLMIRADRGNIGAVSTLSGIPDVNINTGVNMAINVCHYFYDN
jgi:hypothetical protein